MLIHLGGQEFIDLRNCVAIFNLQTIDADTQRIALGKASSVISTSSSDNTEIEQQPRSAVLTNDGRWIITPISSETLGERCVDLFYPGAVYFRSSAKKNY